MYVGIDGKCGLAKTLRNYNAGRFMTDPRKCFEFFQGLWHHALISLGEDLGQAFDVLGFGWCEATGSDGSQNLLDGQLCHLLRCTSFLKESRCHQVHAGVRRLC